MKTPPLPNTPSQDQIRTLCATRPDLVAEMLNAFRWLQINGNLDEIPPPTDATGNHVKKCLDAAQDICREIGTLPQPSDPFAFELDRVINERRGAEHLHALMFRLSNERIRHREAKTPSEQKLRAVWIQQLEKEICAEKSFIGEPADEPKLSDSELLAALEP